LNRLPIVLSALLIMLVVGVFIGLILGPVNINSGQILSALFSHGGNNITHTLIWDLRLPRVMAAMLAGACLGVAGCLLQNSTRNPLGDSQLFGLGGGAAVVQALAMAGIITVNTWGLFTLSVVVSLIGAGIISFFASWQGLSPARLALIGVSISALAAAVTTGILAGARVFSAQSLTFVGGSFANRGWQDVVPALPFAGMGIVISLSTVGNLNALVLGDQVAANLGARPARTRIIAIVSSGILGGTAVAIAGLVGFVGLLVPHISRLLIGYDVRRTFVVSILLGAVITLYADQAARLVFMPSEVPVGLITALFGAPMMIYVARRTLWN